MYNVTIDKKVAICVLIRDCEKALPTMLQKIEKIRKHFSDSRVFIVENNSVDSSKKQISDYKQSAHGVVVYSFDDPDLDKKDRIERMVIARNSYLKMVKSETQFVPDYLIAVDGDVDFKINGVINAIDNAPDDWVSLSANGRYFLKFLRMRIPVLYYDLFALLPIGSEKFMFTIDELLANRPKIQKALKNNKYVKCKSGFGGIAIYRYDKIADKDYTLIENKASKDLSQLAEKHICEHLPFNINLLKFGNNYICRDMLVYYEKISYKSYLAIIVKRILFKKP